MDEKTAPPDMSKHHQNNLAHARAVYISVLKSAPKELWIPELRALEAAMYKDIFGTNHPAEGFKA